MKSFGDRLKYLRGASSQAEIAATLGVPQMTLSNYETGKSEPKFVMIQKICSLFMVGSDWLLFGHGPMRPVETPHALKMQTEKPTPAPEAAALCARCVKLEAELELEKAERRGLSDENRQWAVKMEQLLRENGDLRESCAKFEERLACGNLGRRSQQDYVPTGRQSTLKL